MLLRRYGSKIQSVEPNFDPLAISEIGFNRTSDFAGPAEEFLDEHERIEEHELSARAEGEVKTEVERELLEDLLARLNDLREGARPGELLLVENRAGHDHPRLHDRTTTHVVAGRNRFHFEYRLDPPLRIGVYRRGEG